MRWRSNCSAPAAWAPIRRTWGRRRPRWARLTRWKRPIGWCRAIARTPGCFGAACPWNTFSGIGWAISVPACIQCSAPTIAQRGLAYGMECVQCDGNDIFAVVKVMEDAIKRAREDNRPTFIEALTYRIGDHTTADDARRYRDAA